MLKERHVINQHAIKEKFYETHSTYPRQAVGFSPPGVRFAFYLIKLSIKTIFSYYKQ